MTALIFLSLATTASIIFIARLRQLHLFYVKLRPLQLFLSQITSASFVLNIKLRQLQLDYITTTSMSMSNNSN